MLNKEINKIIKKYNSEEKKRCPFPTGILKVDFGALESNILKIKKFANKRKEQDVKYLCPVKSNAYGSGMIPIAKFIEYKKLCSYLGVAHLEEALELRENGIKMPILIMGQSFCEKENIRCIIQNNIEQAVSDTNIVKALNKEAEKLNKTSLVHLLIDTGMGRCGALPKDFTSLLDEIYKCKNVRLAGVMTHFPVSDAADKKSIKYTNKQIEIFRKLKNTVIKKFSRKDIIFHTSNSGGTIEHQNSVFDMIRPGIATYGYVEHDFGLNLNPVMGLESKIALVKEYPKNHAIGYGCTYKTKKDNERIAIVPIGYGDGLSRLLSNKLTPIVNKKKTKSVGRISMDQFAIFVDKKEKVGDKVIIIGEQGETKNNAYDMALQAKTITYEVICSLGNSKRMRHEYFYSEKFKFIT